VTIHHPSDEDSGGATGAGDGSRRTVVVGLVATPPDHPARIAGRLADDLPVLLADRSDTRTRWEVRTGRGQVAPRRDRGYEGLVDDVDDRRRKAGWDVAICLTDLPLQLHRVPLVAHASMRRCCGLISLPALGLGQLRGTRDAAVGLVEGLTADRDDRAGSSPDQRLARLAEGVAPIRRVIDHTDDGEVGFVGSSLVGQLRLLLGMVRANRPGRALLGLSKLLVGAFGTAAFALTTNTIWQMGDALGGPRLTAVMLLSIAALVVWLVVAHDLWERATPDTPRELARLFNVGTVLTLGLATAVSYLVLLVSSAAAAALLIDQSMLAQTLGRPVGPLDYLTLGWIISSLATVGGAIGSGLESSEQVRAAAYGYHPTPDGWHDEQE
jgi:hypothetical protein